MKADTPSRIGKYNVVAVIGRGGMGVVYKAIDPFLDRQVAIKMMTGGFVDTLDLRKRFFLEAQSLGNLQHPNIVTVYDLGDHDGNPYLVMEYLEGATLDEVFASRRQLNLLEKTNIVIQVCNGLAHAHQRSVVHRDIKPSNIMLERTGGIKIFDFGIARVRDQKVTLTGQVVGTPPYMSPEQINSKVVDARSDLFSVGVVLYQLCTGHLPFEGDNPANTFLKILYEAPPPLKTFLSAYPPDLDTILQRALAKDPAERYHSADEFAVDLRQLHAQLGQELIDHQMREVGLLLAKPELQRAREILIQVLRADPQHIVATQLMREVERRIQKEEINEQVCKLQEHAEDAIEQRQLETAQSYLDQALSLDRNNEALVRLAESVRAAVIQSQKLRIALKSAESAHQNGDLDTAKRSVEEALQIAPNDTQARALQRIVQREWADRARQRQLGNYLSQARQQISSRKFTAALETLKLAETIDPSAPEIHALLESAETGLEEGRRREDVDAIVRDIESALNRDDYRAACKKAEEGLSRFPEERTILNLKALADRQRHFDERRQFVEEQLAVARKLMQEKRNEELLTTLEAALRNVGVEPRLQNLLAIVTENVQRERLEKRKTEYLQQAKVFLRNQEYESAIRGLEDARVELKNEPEIEDLLLFAKAEAAADKGRRAVEAVSEKTQALIAERKYEDATRLLETALRENPDAGQRIMLGEIRHVADDYQQRLGTTKALAEELLQAGSINEAVRLLESQPAAHLQSPTLHKLLETARSKAESLLRVREVVEQSQRMCDQGDYSAASRVLDEWRTINRAAPEIEAQATKVEELRLSAAHRAVEKGMGDARVLVAGAEYEAGLAKLQSVLEFVADLPEALAAEYRSLRTVARAKALASTGQLQAALDEVRTNLKTYPEDVSLLELKNTLLERVRQDEDQAEQERARLDREAFLDDVSRCLEGESALEQRMAILDKALVRFPDDQKLRQKSSVIRDLIARVSSLTLEARALEAAGKFDEALGQWTTLRGVHPTQPGLDENISRVTRLRDQAHAKAKVDCLQKKRHELTGANLELTGILLHEAKKRFPNGQDSMLLEVQLGEAVKARAKAEKLLAEASNAFERSRWKKGIGALNHALEIAGTDAWVQDHALNCLTIASEKAVATDVNTARMLFDRAALLCPTSATVSELERKIEGRERENTIVARLNSVRRAQQSGDLEGAHLQLIQAIKSYPDEQRLVDAKSDIERRQQLAERHRARERERVRQLELEQERELERTRQEAAERDRVHAAEAGRKGLDKQEREHLRAKKAERQQHDELEREKAHHREAEPKESKRQWKEEEKARNREECKREAEVASERQEEEPAVARTVAPSDRSEISATSVFESPPSATETSSRSLPIPAHGKEPIFRFATVASTRNAILVGGGLLGVLAVIVLWKVLLSRTIPIQLTTTPEGATVTLVAASQPNLKRECLSPHCNLYLSPGTYSLRIQHAGFDQTNRTIEVSAKGPRSFAVTLEAAAQPPSELREAPNSTIGSQKPARLQIRGIAGGAELLIDGVSVGRVGHNGEISVKVPAGRHRVEVLAKDQHSNPVTRNFEGGQLVSLAKDDLYPTAPLLPDDVDWQAVINAASIDSVEQFLSRHPNGTHRAEAQAKREELYWQIAQNSGSAEDLERYIRLYPSGEHASEASTRIDELDWQHARAANSAAAFNEYLGKHPDGKHAGSAALEIDNTELPSMENATDPVLLEEYLSKHPTGTNHDRIHSRLDILTWERTNKKELADLRSYLTKFPTGRYVADANTAINGLSSQVKDLQGIKAAIERYRDAYESESPGDMSKAWPGISKQQLKAITETFNRFSAIKLRIECPDDDIHIVKQQASASCQQSARYTLRGKIQPEKPSKVKLGFKNLGNGVWVVESVSSQ